MIRHIAAVLLGVALGAGAATAQTCGALPNTLANGTNADATQVMANFTALLNCINALPSSNGSLVPAQGRLTLTTGTPVMSASVSAATTVYYTPYAGNQIAISNGASFVPTAFTELSNITTNSSTGNAGPAAVAANGNYDLFVWSNSGTPTLTRGPAWTTDTTRNLALQRINGIWTNGSAIANGPAANLGTYVGTVRSDGSSQINWQLGGVAANGTAAVLGVWNLYNRVSFAGFIGDTTVNWTYSSTTIRPANNSSTMRASFVQGLIEDVFDVTYNALASQSGGGAMVGIGYDSTTAFTGQIGHNSSGSGATQVYGSHRVQALGFHYVQACEQSDAAGSHTFYGSGGSAQSGLTYTGRF
ncbi:MAG: hypothetical protein J0J01_13015 [Reyranella sp.]|uniref:hypothetical protein n=1 Tax=Reyranella sp. TaxID=1929291 RepID=UPI001AC9FDFE|nr:hypothetical protein [Reyranella sp.]MBN9087824.1 hypothetical protein [Reyranella sp.]